MKIKVFSIITVIVLANCINAQQTSTSPYSSLGLGDTKANTEMVISSMGGTGTAFISDFSNEANFTNPAANRNLHYTTFNLGLNTDFTSAKTSTQSSDRSTTYLSNLSLAFPIGKKDKAGLSLNPYTSLGYDMSIDQLVPVEQKSVLKGRGGLNSFNAFYAYNLTNEFSLGAKLGYVWGQLKKEQDNSVNGAPYISSIYNEKEYGFLDYTLGATYQKKLKKDHKLTIGALYNIGRTVNTDINYLTSTYYFNGSGEKQIDTLSFVHGSYNTKIPTSLSLGVAYGKEYKWSLAADFKYTNQSNLKIPEDDFKYKDRYRFALGGWVLPNLNGFKSYFEKVIYRYGIYYENTGIELYNHTINQYGVTAGMSLPIGKPGRKDPSLLNIGVELGQRGTKSNGLIKENFVNVRVGFNFDDLWFKRRKYD